MNAMILAAGFGRRLLPMTERIPKALVLIQGQPILQLLLQRLEHAGFNKVAINVHHLANHIEHFLDSYRKQTDIKIHLSYEPELLSTGGGIKKMSRFFADDEPVLVQNVDILSSIDYNVLMQYHIDSHADSTLVINSNKTDRPLAFTKDLVLLGRGDANSVLNYCFCGIQVIQPKLFRYVDEDIFYSIDIYCKAAQKTGSIIGFDITGQYWKDIGAPADLRMAEEDIRRGELSF